MLHVLLVSVLCSQPEPRSVSGSSRDPCPFLTTVAQCGGFVFDRSRCGSSVNSLCDRNPNPAMAGFFLVACVA